MIAWLRWFLPRPRRAIRCQHHGCTTAVPFPSPAGESGYYCQQHQLRYDKPLGYVPPELYQAIDAWKSPHETPPRDIREPSVNPRLFVP